MQGILNMTCGNTWQAHPEYTREQAQMRSVKGDAIDRDPAG